MIRVEIELSIPIGAGDSALYVGALIADALHTATCESRTQVVVHRYTVEEADA